MTQVAFGLNRLDLRSPERFAADAARLESLGWSYGFIPSSPLLVLDPYVMLAEGLRNTRRIVLGPLIENPVMRHPAVIAGSIATVDRLAPGRTVLGMGVGDTAVRLVGKRPATVAEFEEAIRTIRELNAGERLAVNAARPAVLRHAARVPVWVAAQGPKTLRMAGRVADGVFIRVGVHPTNLRLAVDAVRSGALEAGRDPAEVRIGCVFHTVVDDDAERARRIGRAVAAGYYEYSPMLFDHVGLSWDGPGVEVLKRRVWPDFHHARDLEAAGEVVSFCRRRRWMRSRCTDRFPRSSSRFGRSSATACRSRRSCPTRCRRRRPGRTEASTMRGRSRRPCSRRSETRSQKNTNIRTSQLSRGGLWGGVAASCVGRRNAVCAVNRARPSVAESYTLNSSASSGVMRGNQ